MNAVFNCMTKKQGRGFKLPLRDKEDFKSKKILFSNEWGSSFHFSTQRKSKCFQM